MLSLQEALMLKAAQEEVEQQQALQTAAILGGGGGALIGAAGGAVPHQVGRGLNAITGRKPNRVKPGFRAAGGLTGLILRGGLGAGAAALMKQENEAAQLLGKIQATGKLSTNDEVKLANLLGDIYSNQSKLA